MPFRICCISIAKRALIRATTLILYDTFGGEDTRDKLWHRLTTAGPGTSFRLSPGNQTIHLVHIDDVVRAFLLAAELLQVSADSEPMYTVHSSEPRALRSLVEELDSKAALDLDLQWGALPYWEGQVLEPWVGKPLPGWESKISVPDALVQLACTNRAGLSDSREPQAHG